MQAGEPMPANASGTDQGTGTAGLGASKGALVPGKAKVPAVSGHEALPPALSATLSPAALLTAFRRRWFVAVTLGLISAGIVAAGVWVAFPSGGHTAHTLLHIADRQPVVIAAIPENQADFGNYQRTQLVLIKSLPVLNAALRDPKVKKLPAVQKRINPIGWLKEEIKADFSLAPSILRISMSGHDPEQLTLLLDAVREAYLSEIVNKEHNLRLERLKQLKDMHAERDRVWQEKRNALRLLKNDLGAGDGKLLAIKQEYDERELNALRTELFQLESQLRTARWEAQLQPDPEKALANLPIRESQVEQTLRNDPVIDQHIKEIAQLEKDLVAIEKRAVNLKAEPAYRQKMASLGIAKKALADRREELRAQAVKQVRDKARAELETKQQLARDRLVFQEAYHKQLSKEVKDRVEKNQGLRKKAVDLSWLQEEIAQVEEMARQLGRRVQNLEVEIQAPSRIRLLEETVVEANSDKRVRMAGMGFVGMFGLVVFGISWWEFRARKVSNVDEVAQGLRIRLMGTIPNSPRPARLAAMGATKPQDSWLGNPFVESVDATRMMLVHMAQAESLRVIMVTSAFGGEGKTMLSTQLAISLARAGHRILLVDADLRRPAVHKLFEVPGSPGLAEILRGEVTAADAIRPGPRDGLFLLPAGNALGQAPTCLAQGNLAALFQQLKEEYDYIVVDSAPVLPVADSQAIGQHADGVVLSVLCDVSRLPSIHAAYKRLTMLNIRVLGAVVHGVATNSYDPSGYALSSQTASA